MKRQILRNRALRSYRRMKHRKERGAIWRGRGCSRRNDWHGMRDEALQGTNRRLVRSKSKKRDLRPEGGPMPQSHYARTVLILGAVLSLALSSSAFACLISVANLSLWQAVQEAELLQHLPELTPLCSPELTHPST